MKVTVIGGGLAGTESALQLAKKGIEVDLYEMRPVKQTGAHKTEFLAELVCSNSLGSNDTNGASGLLKAELRKLDCEVLKVIDEFKVPAGNALATDRELYAKKLTEIVENHPKINLIREELKEIPKDTPVIIASGPLTSKDLTVNIMEFTKEKNLYFFDAIAPIIEKDSIDFDKAFWASRYDKGEASYINCPMNKEQYENFYNILTTAEKIELKEFEKDAKFFESCLPVEILASRGVDTLRYGPLKPVGLIDKRTEEKNYAVVQLRQDNMAASLYNMVGFQTNLKWGEQKKLIHSIPGLENANIVRYGVMHRNTFIFAPKVLKRSLQCQNRKDLFFAGQISGVEGYTESIATGLVAGINMAKFLNQEELFEPSSVTMLGSLTKYITFEEHKKLDPINSNWGIIKPIEGLDKKTRKDKKLRNSLYAKRSLEYLDELNF